MAIQGVIYQNQKVSAEDHAALFQMFISDGILSGCGVSKLRNVLTISSGMFVLAGRLSKIIGSEQITIPDTIRSTTVRLTGVIDLTQSATKTEFHQFSFRLDAASGGTYPALRKENINTGNGQYYEVEWAILTIDSDGNIANVETKIGNSEGTTPGGGGGSESDFHFDTENGMLYVKEGSDWEVAFLKSGTLTLDKSLSNVDIFIVDAGGNGSSGATGDSSGGSGGNGAKMQLIANTTIPSGVYPITIGENAAARTYIGSSSNPNYAVDPEVGFQAGGSPAIGGQTGNVAAETVEGVRDGTLAFGDSSTLIFAGRLYGAPGGGGGERSAYAGTYHAGADGANTGAGNGGNDSHKEGYDASANTGSGGGGGFGHATSPSGGGGVGYAGGKGGSGIILIRPVRTAS